MSCNKASQNVCFYFFDNGKACNPERVRKLRLEAAKVICKKGKTYAYKGKTWGSFYHQDKLVSINIFSLYTLDGEPVCSFNPLALPSSSAYVLVPSCETFMYREYECAFQKVLAERKAQARCKSLPAVTGGDSCPPPRSDSRCPPKPFVPCNVKSTCPKVEDSCCESNPSQTCASPSFGQNIKARRDGCTGCPRAKPPQRHDKCERSALCELEDSDACIVCPENPRINYKCKSRRPPTPMVMRKNKGFFASCCPCCVKKYYCKKLEERPVTSGCSPNAKLTQTTKEDFSMSRKRLQQAMREERQRQSLYARRNSNACKARRDICPAIDDDEDFDDPRKILKREKAREKYCLKRRKMEQRLTKSLEKQYKKCG